MLLMKYCLCRLYKRFFAFSFVCLALSNDYIYIVLVRDYVAVKMDDDDIAAVGPEQFGLGYVVQLNRRSQTFIVVWHKTTAKNPYTGIYRARLRQDPSRSSTVGVENVIAVVPKMTQAGRLPKRPVDYGGVIRQRLRNWEDGHDALHDVDRVGVVDAEYDEAIADENISQVRVANPEFASESGLPSALAYVKSCSRPNQRPRKKRKKFRTQPCTTPKKKKQTRRSKKKKKTRRKENSGDEEWTGGGWVNTGKQRKSTRKRKR
jgi:hypothetical protein